MREQGLAGLVVVALDRYTAPMYYVTGQRIVHGIYLRGADGRAHLLHDAMERDQAAAVGCEHSSFAQHGYQQIQQEERSPARVMGRLVGEMAATMRLDGPIGFFGDLGAGTAYELITRAREIHPAMQVADKFPDVITLARTTKNDDEIEAIRHASNGVVAAWNEMLAYLASLKRDGDHFVNGAGRVTLGDLRTRLNLEFTRAGLEGGDSIVAQGRDAGVPHNRGNNSDLLTAGHPVIVDIFPGEAGGGYYSDFTRTICMGKASSDLRRMYGDVEDAFRLAMDSVKVGGPCRSYQEAVCDLFEQRGHATLRTNATAEEGYVHGLGHGVGLAVHEAPRLGGPPSNTTVLEPRMVITIEPGLYYPSRGMGARIEDLVLVRPDGKMENLTPAPYTFEIEPRG